VNSAAQAGKVPPATHRLQRSGPSLSGRYNRHTTEAGVSAGIRQLHWTLSQSSSRFYSQQPVLLWPRSIRPAC